MAMRLDAATSLRFGLIISLTAMCGCLSATELDDQGEIANTASTQAPIVSGAVASSYPEAALVNMLVDGHQRAACSGAVIAPKVVLTAGHCVYGFNGWNIHTPFADGQTASASEAVTYDWKVDSHYVDPNRHDIGLVFLDRPITLKSYPALSPAAVPSEQQIVNVGRIQSGQLSNSALFVSKPMSVTDGKESGFPFSYAASEIIESGDSGGPDLLSSSHTIVAVNSGAGGGSEVLARVDLLHSWIVQQVEAHGGAGTVAQGGGTEKLRVAPAGPAEEEPNDDYSAADPLDGSREGALAGGDQDWFTFSLDRQSYYDVSVAATGDAVVQMWRLSDSSYAQIANTSATELEHVSSGPGRYVLAVYSPSGEAQSYTVKLQK